MNITQFLRCNCSKPIAILDIGSGYSTQLLSEICRTSYIISIDTDPNKLEKLKGLTYKNMNIELVNCDASMNPLRSSCIDLAFAALTIHELPRDSVDNALSEISRVLKINGTLLMIDKVRGEAHSIAEALPYIVEYVYHRVRELLGISKPALLPQTISKYLELVSKYFTVTEHGVHELSPWTEPQKFLSSWGKTTKELYRELPSPWKARIGNLIRLIEAHAKAQGYGPTKGLVLIAKPKKQS